MSVIVADSCDWSLDLFIIGEGHSRRKMCHSGKVCYLYLHIVANAVEFSSPINLGPLGII